VNLTDTLLQSWTWVGSIHGLGRVGLDWLGRKITTFCKLGVGLGQAVCLLPPMGDRAVVSFSLCFITAPNSMQLYTSNLIRPNYAKSDWSSICCFLSTICWSNVFYSYNSIEQYWDPFVYVVDESVNNFIPHFRPNVKHYPSYVRKLLFKKHSCWKLYRQFRSNE